MTGSIPGAALVVATLNRDKAREILALLADLPLDAHVLGDVPGATLPEETGRTYADNALIKARAAARQTGTRAIADDSGLEVDALSGAPGVWSARYGGPGLDDAGRTAALLDALRDVPAERRTARYRCVIALVHPDGREATVEGVVEGFIATSPRGAGGFGYDPIFVYPPFGRTFAEMTSAQKAEVSHRARAVRALRTLLVG